MPGADLLSKANQVMTVCNACRYCEQYCPVFPAMEERRTFTASDLTYLANLCHNCGECLYACQYAPPHEYGINVARTLAELRVGSYEDFCWPQPLGRAFRTQGLFTALALASLLSFAIFAGVWITNPVSLWQARPEGDFYSVIPHHVMVTLFGAVGLFVVLALAISTTRFWRSAHDPALDGRLSLRAAVRGLWDALTLRHLHATGVDCTTGEEQRTRWRRWFHHATFYGFLLCFASTSVAAVYHSVFGWHAPYGYASAPVLLGTVGGIGLIVGPLGLLAQRRLRDHDMADPSQQGLDESFLLLLLLTSLTGLVLLVLRTGPLMPGLLIVHLGVVLALFVTLPYGKFVHGFFRTAALVKYAIEMARSTSGTSHA